jgi:hypothetical protein
MAKVLCVLYDNPIGGYPNSYPRDSIPQISRYPGAAAFLQRRRERLAPALARCQSATEERLRGPIGTVPFAKACRLAPCH